MAEQAYQRGLKDMCASEIIKRCVYLCAALFIMAFGVAFSIKGDLGTSPISSLPYVGSLILPLTVGQTTIILHCILIALQIVILRKRYQLIQLLQLPCALIFGVMNDVALRIIDRVNPTSYGMRWVCCLIGIVLIAIGVSMEVTSRVTTIAGEGFVLALCQVLPQKFSTLKISFDVALVVISCILSAIFLRTIAGVREGTLAAAIFVGLLTRVLNPLAGKFERKALMTRGGRT